MSFPSKPVHRVLPFPHLLCRVFIRFSLFFGVSSSQVFPLLLLCAQAVLSRGRTTSSGWPSCPPPSHSMKKCASDLWEMFGVKTDLCLCCLSGLSKSVQIVFCVHNVFFLQQIRDCISFSFFFVFSSEKSCGPKL